MVEQRPRPAHPPPGQGRRPPPPLRRIPDLFTDTFGLARRRVSDLAVVAIVAAAIAVGVVSLFTVSTQVLIDELIENPEAERLMDLLDQPDIQVDDVRTALNDWFEAIDRDRLLDAFVVLVLGLALALLGIGPAVAASVIALDDTEGGSVTAGQALRTGFGRLPKVLLLALLYLIALGAVAFVIVLVSAANAILAIAAAIGTAVVLAVAAPFIQLHFVVAYVQPGMPTPRRCWALASVAKAATWGRIALVWLVYGLAQSTLGGVGLLLPDPYGDFLSGVILGPVFAVLSAIAYVLVYADLSGRSRLNVEEGPEPGS